MTITHCVSKQVSLTSGEENFAWFTCAGDALNFARGHAKDHISQNVRVIDSATHANVETFYGIEMDHGARVAKEVIDEVLTADTRRDLAHRQDPAERCSECDVANAPEALRCISCGFKFTR